MARATIAGADLEKIKEFNAKRSAAVELEAQSPELSLKEPKYLERPKGPTMKMADKSSI